MLQMKTKKDDDKKIIFLIFNALFKSLFLCFERGQLFDHFEINTMQFDLFFSIHHAAV